MSFWWLFAFCFGAYMFGNINIAVLISKFIFKSDIRTFGSGNPGASNILRAHGTKWGILVLFLDMLKGVIPTLCAWIAFGAGYDFHPLHATSNSAGQIAMYACGLAVVLGHCFPVVSKFKGGKGVATTVGVFCVTNPVVGIAGLSIGMLLGVFLEYPSVSSFVFITFAVLWEGFLNNAGAAVYAMLIGFYFLLLFTHRKNIYRILSGRERRASLFKRRKKQVINSAPAQ
jgi:glycerol-3-phosphate acyltransferase PlsY